MDNMTQIDCLHLHRIRTAAQWLILASLLAIIAACGIDEKPLPPQPAPYITAHQATVPVYLTFVATTQAPLIVGITARTPGYIEEILFQDGDDVIAGQPLYTIESTINRAQVQQARAALQSAQANAKQATLDYSRYQKLANEGAVSKEILDNQRLRRDQARDSVTQAQAELTEAQKTLSYTQITAPFSGRISRTLYSVGNLVGVGGDTVLTTLVTLDPIYVYFNVPSTQLQQLLAVRDQQPDVPVVFTLTGATAPTALTFKGTLEFIDNQVSATSGTISMRATVSNPDKKLYPGQFGSAALQIGQYDNVLLVPQAIVKQDIEGNYLFTVDGNNQLQRKNVQLGDTFDHWVIVKQGITASDHIVSGHLLLMRSGLVVAPEPDKNFPVPAALQQ